MSGRSPPSRVPTLIHLCVQKLAQNLIRYGPKKVRFGRLCALPRHALEALLEILVERNALNDNVLPHALTRQTQTLGLEGAAQLRRCVLNTIGRSCPNLRVLDIRMCQQVDNRIVRDVLQQCEHLEILRLDGCTRISDSAFVPAHWKPPLAGLLGLVELSVGKCSQITAEGLMGYVMKGAPYMRRMNLASCRMAIVDEVASELLFSFGLEVLDLSFCDKITDAPFQARFSCSLRELHIANTAVTDLAVERLAAYAPMLEVFDAGWVMKLTDRGVLALVKACNRLRTLCICNTQVTDVSFKAISMCPTLECLDASWCLRATTQALDIMAAAPEDSRPRIRNLVLDHLGALNLDAGSLPPAMTVSPGLNSASAPLVSPLLKHQLPSLALPPPAFQMQQQGVPLDDNRDLTSGALATSVISSSGGGIGGTGGCGNSSVVGSIVFDVGIDAALGGLFTLPDPLLPSLPPPLSPSLLLLVTPYAASLEQLFLEGVRDVTSAAALEIIAEKCTGLRQLALTIPASRDSDAAVEAAFRSIGAKCEQLDLLRFDSTARPHWPVVAALAYPSFGRLRNLMLWAYAKSGGLLDSELEVILSGRTGLEKLALRNCEGLTEGLFSKWCNRHEKTDEAEDRERLDQVLLSSLNFGGPHVELSSTSGPLVAASPQTSPPRTYNARRRGRHHLRHPAAQALRSVNSFSLCGATGLTDRASDALAELLHDAQLVDIRGSMLLTDEALRSFRKGCRFLRSVCIVTRDRTLSWTAATSAVKKHHHHRKSSFYTSGSSGTESN
eukprot:TRINITY_DN18265_c0_g1_i1.p1 TRINITY_DN18265_c0_g1~~TRINITY_DN18265_c0_g1_i1.p1  ORF type:complete len:784 (+),score=109.01 TRINITY_DN18265_c0_g1_i1:205-2556(+)